MMRLFIIGITVFILLACSSKDRARSNADPLQNTLPVEVEDSLPKKSESAFKKSSCCLKMPVRGTQKVQK